MTAEDEPEEYGQKKRRKHVEEATIGSLNGPWAKIFKLTLASYALFFAPVLGWGTWMTVAMIEVKDNGEDSVSIPMFVEAQGELAVKNPTTDWLTASEVITIHNHYRD